MAPLVARISSAKRKRLFGSKAIFEPYKPASASELRQIEEQLACALPEDLRTWLLEAGYGDFNEVFALRKEWFRVIDRGPLKGHVIFAQDILGNFYSFSPADGRVHFICRSAPEYALMARDFRSLLEELERRDFNLQEWVDGLPSSPYEWGV
jgi:hypothetical protein